MKYLNLFLLVASLLVHGQGQLPDQLFSMDYQQKPVEREDLSYGPNELGRIPVLMYHDVQEDPKYYGVTPEAFQKTLGYLHAHNYQMISIEDYSSGLINIPKGKHPVLITFDDGVISQMKYDEEGKLTSDSAVGILVEFYQEHPDFGFAPVFFLMGNEPFSQRPYSQEKLDFLLEMGATIGNHTKDHVKLSQLNKVDALSQLRDNKTYYLDRFQIEMKDYLAAPFGITPEGYSVDMPTFLVGWRPALPATHKDFNPDRINRIQAGEAEFQSSYWLTYLEEHPEELYTSDGHEELLTIPSYLADKVREEWLIHHQMRLRIREDSNDH